MQNMTYVMTFLIATVFTSLALTSSLAISRVKPANFTARNVSLFRDEKTFEPAPPDNSGYYSVRNDMRRCASPMCGGQFVKLVNQSLTRCANLRYMSECYVASIDWNGLSAGDNKRTLLRGSIVTSGNRNGKYGVFMVTEVWQSASNQSPTGVFYRVKDRGVRCIAAPCPSHQEARLNSIWNQNVAGVDLSTAGASSDVLSDAYTAMTGANGVIVAGTHEPVTGPAGRSEQLKASQFYLQVKSSASNKPCIKTGCSGQVCAEQNVMTTCEYRKEYECYRKATCERQADGNCGFTKTRELVSCLSVR